MGRDGGCDQGNNECTGKTDGKKIQFTFVHDRLTRNDVSGDQTVPLFGLNKTCPGITPDRRQLSTG
jgi:hypothetical protein